jgi:GNAT superfamily N-acetyltransferase
VGQVEQVMGPVAEVETATQADASRLVALINRAFAVERFFMTSDRTTLEQVEGYLAAGEFLVVRGGEQLAACVYVERRGDRAYLGMLSVDPSRQKSGLGRLMMDAAETRARQRGCRAVDIRVVNLREELPPFYRARGYVERGQEEFDNPFATRPAHYILMTKELES